jgi:hypothetical protein
MEVSCPGVIPPGVFEFQHSYGQDPETSIVSGFQDWMSLDLPVFLDALSPAPNHCSAINLDFPAEGGTPPRSRRGMLGPVGHYAEKPATETEEHPFCRCCLLTKSLEAFKDKVSSEGFFAIRLYAARDPEDGASADCRVNGLDYEPGKAALIKYAATWPARGIEFRKQYVIIQSRPPPGR